MPALEAIATTAVANLVRRAGSHILEKVAKQGHVGEVIAEVARQGGAVADEKGLATLARENPEGFARAVEAAEKANAARWAAILAETKHTSIFVAGARPAALWACVAILLYSGLMVPLANWILQSIGYAFSNPDLPALSHPPQVAWETLIWLIPLLYGIRAIEGGLGVKRSTL
jgi:hypothetical protein